MPYKFNPITGKRDYYESSTSAVNEAKAYADSIVLGLLDDRGSFTPSGSYPDAGGSGAAGAIMKGDVWYITGLGAGVNNTVGSQTVKDGDTVRALSDNPGQTNSNWDVMSSPVNATTLQTIINAATSQTTPADTDNIPVTDGVSGNPFKRLTWATIKSFFVLKNSSITGATKTKITYDSKGLVTAGADATTVDIADSTNKRYVTDAQLTVIGNTSGTNTGDQTFLDARVQSVTSSATVTATSTNDLVKITAQAVNLTLANPTGTFTEGQALMFRIKDNGTARTITFGAKFRAIGVTLPTTTVISKIMYLGVIYNATDDKFDVVGLNQEA